MARRPQNQGQCKPIGNTKKPRILTTQGFQNIQLKKVTIIKRLLFLFFWWPIGG